MRPWRQDDQRSLRDALGGGCSTAISSNSSTFLCDSSFSSLISRSAVMGNWQVISSGAGQGDRLAQTNPVFLIMHNNLLQGKDLATLLRPRSIDLAGQRSCCQSAAVAWVGRSSLTRMYPRPACPGARSRVFASSPGTRTWVADVAARRNAGRVAAVHLHRSWPSRSIRDEARMRPECRWVR